MEHYNFTFWLPPIILMVLMIGFILYINLSHKKPPPKPKLFVTVYGKKAIIDSRITVKDTIYIRRLLKAMKKNYE